MVVYCSTKRGDILFVEIIIIPQVKSRTVIKDERRSSVHIPEKQIDAAKSFVEKTVEAAATSDALVAPFLEGLTVRKIIVVPGRIVNIVAS